jgi:L-alanine-DL-glutamate epimerase-like enolase superfamily enzyme
MSFSPLNRRTMILVELETTEGLIGFGESWANFPPWIEHERLATLREGLFPLIVGAPYDDIAAIHLRLLGRLEAIGRQWGAPGPIMQAISAVDIALWDLAGKVRGQSIADVVSRVRTHIPAYASSLGPENVRSQAERCRDAGHHAVKVKLGFGRDRDKANLEATRAVCGDDIRIYADANQAWSLQQAVEMTDVLKGVGVAWIEEPLRGNSLHELEMLHQQTGMDIATGENVYGRKEFGAYCRSSGVQVIQPDVTKCGGLTEVFEICRMASEAKKTVMPHLYGGAVGFAATLQLAGAAPPVTAIEYDVRENPLRDPIWSGAPAPVAGVLQIPSGPGLGMTPDMRQLEHYAGGL